VLSLIVLTARRATLQATSGVRGGPLSSRTHTARTAPPRAGLNWDRFRTSGCGDELGSI